MAYIGREPTNSGQFLLIDDISSQFNGSKQSFTLQVGGNDITPAKENIIVAIDGVLQEATSAYSVSGSTITFTGSPASDASFYGVLTGESQFIANNSISDDNISPTANISGSKINTDFSAQSFQLTNVTASGDISGSSSSTFSGGTSTFTNYGGNVSGSSTSTGSFGRVKADGGVVVDDITIDGTEIDLSSGDLTVDVEGDIILDANGADIKLKDNGTEFGRLSRVSSDLVIKSISNNNDILFKGVDASSTITALQLDMSEKGNAIFNNDVTIAGTLTAQEIHTEFESASILFTSGSTRFGDDTTDTHRVTGSMDISGSLQLPHGDVTITDNLAVDGTTNLDNTDIDGTLTVDGGNIVFNEDSADQDFRVESNGNANMLFVDGGQNAVGIGTNNAGASGEKLLIVGNDNQNFLVVSSSNDDNFISIGTFENDQAIIGFGNKATTPTALNFYAANRPPIGGSNLVMSLSGSGNVGIGTGSPDQKLHLYSTTSNSPNILIQNENDSAGEAGNAGGIEFYLKDDNGSNPDFQDLGIIRWTGHDKDNPYNKFTAAAITGSSDDPGNSSGRIDFGVAYSDSMINAMTIRAAAAGDAKVGIGTGTPGDELHVYRNQSAFARILVENEGTSTTSQALFGTKSNAGTINFGITPTQHSFSGDAIIYNTANTGIRIATNNATRMVILNDGKVGIGTTTPTAQLHVSGSGSSQGTLIVDSGNNDPKHFELRSTGDIAHGMTDLEDTATFFRVNKNSSTDGGAQIAAYTENTIAMEFVPRVTNEISAASPSTSDQAPFQVVVAKKSSGSVQALDASKMLVAFRNHSNTRFIFDSDGRGYADNTFTTFSDSRLKKDVIEIPYGLETVNKLKPKKYVRHSGNIENGNVVLEENGWDEVGFIAQDVKELIPELISNPDCDESKGFYAMDDGKMTSILVKAIQELSTKVTKLEAQISGSN